MIHDIFFEPYVIQSLINSIRDCIDCDKLILNNFMNLVDHKKTNTKIKLVKCSVFNAGKKSELYIIQNNDRIYFSNLKKIDIGKISFIIYGDTIDMNGKFVIPEVIIPRISRWETNYIPTGYASYIRKPKPREKKYKVNDEEFLNLVLVRQWKVGWAYEININKNTAYHIISLDKEHQELYETNKK